MQQCIDYIYEKPMKVGFIDNPSDGLLGIARDYEGKAVPIRLRYGLVGKISPYTFDLKMMFINSACVPLN